MVDYIKVNGTVSDLDCLNEYCEYKKELDSGRKLYLLYNNDYSSNLNLIVNTNSKNIVISGNLRKYKFGSKTLLRDLSYVDFISVLEDIRLKIGATKTEILDFYVNKVEFGANLNLGKKYQNILKCLMEYGKLKKGTYANTVYFDSTKKKIKFYSKIPQVFKQKKLNKAIGKILDRKGMVLRVEYTVKAKSAMPFKNKINTIRDIERNFNYILYFVWLKIFKKIKVADTYSYTRNIEYGSLNLTDMKEYFIHLAIKEMGMDATIEFVNKYSKFKKTKDKDEFYRILEKYQTARIHNFWSEIIKIATKKANSLKMQKNDRRYSNN